MALPLRSAANIKGKTLLLLALGPYCQGCGEDFTKNESSLNIDHIRPVADGRIDHIDNLTLLCRPCNARKRHRWTLSELRSRNSKSPTNGNLHDYRLDPTPVRTWALDNHSSEDFQSLPEEVRRLVVHRRVVVVADNYEDDGYDPTEGDLPCSRAICTNYIPRECATWWFDGTGRTGQLLCLHHLGEKALELALLNGRMQTGRIRARIVHADDADMKDHVILV